MKHEWTRYDTGIGYGGYVQCLICGKNTYEHDIKRDSECYGAKAESVPFTRHMIPIIKLISRKK